MNYTIKKYMARLQSLRRVDPGWPAPTAEEVTLAKEAEDLVRALPHLEVHDTMNDSEKEWTRNRIDLRNLILHGDLRYFLHWQMIRYTMFTTEATYTRYELEHIFRQGISIEALMEDSSGDPDRLFVYPQTSGNLVHHMYHLVEYQRLTSQHPARLPFVLEFGGGYGSLSRLVCRQGHTGNYVIYDLPEFGILQRYYLKSIGVPVLEAQNFNAHATGVTLISDRDDLKKILAQRPKHSMLIATWSISETPVDFRKEFFADVGLFSHYLIAYQDRFNEIDNVNYFKEWIAARKATLWITSRMKHLPGHAYLFGTPSN